MAEYYLAGRGSCTEIGLRAKRLRQLLGLTIEEVAIKAGVEKKEVENLENGAITSLSAALEVHQILSSEKVGETLFTRPRLTNIDEVEAFEQRRIIGR